MTQLRGITWGHVRGVAPLKAAAEEYKKIAPDVSITWDVRSLKDFEDYPLVKLAANYDLILMDHPFIGEGASNEWILPLDEWIPQDYLIDQEKNSVGKSYESYTWDGHQWALAVDAASQVAAYRKDLLDANALKVPKTWKGVSELIQSLPTGMKVGIPLNPTHAFCSFLSIGVNLAGDQFFSENNGFDLLTGQEVIHFLKELIPQLHEGSLEMNPIDMSDLTSQTNEIAYIPLMYGYSNYARPGFAPHVIHFTDIPSNQPKPIGGVLGGVGIAVSAYSQFRKEAAQFAAFVGSAEFQTGEYYTSGGQPGYRAAWTNEKINQSSNGFFIETLQTLDHAFLRPRYMGYPAFQEKAGELIHHNLKSGEDALQVLQSLNDLYRSTIKK